MKFVTSYSLHRNHPLTSSCPRCDVAMSDQNWHALNIQRKAVSSVSCEVCKKELSADAIAIESFIANFNRGLYGTVPDFAGPLVFNASMKTWKVVIEYVALRVKFTIMSDKAIKMKRAAAYKCKVAFQTIITRERPKFYPNCSLDLLNG